MAWAGVSEGGESDPKGFADDVRCDGAGEGAALGLLGLMTGLSEEHWCAGWLNGLEYSLWRVEAGARFGQGEITERQATLLRLLAEEADGWWVWPDGADRPHFLRMEDWLAQLAAP